MTIHVNGTPMELNNDLTVDQLLANRKLSPETVVVEYNGNILPGDQYHSTLLTDGDKLEILRFVGGG